MPELETMLEERRAKHGDFSVQAAIAQGLKAYARDAENYDQLNAVQREAMDMILIKISRIFSGDANEADHWQDIAGYAWLVAKHLKETGN